MDLNEDLVLAWCWDVRLLHVQFVETILAGLPLLGPLRCHVAIGLLCCEGCLQFRNLPMSEYVDVDLNELEDEVVRLSELVLFN